MPNDNLNNIDIASKLFPTWPTIVATLLALLILLLVLTKLVYKPVKNMYEKRRQYVQSNIDESKNQLSIALQDREQACEELLLARNRADAIIQEASKVAEQLKMESVIAAKDGADLIVNQAKTMIKEQQIEFYESSKQIIVDVALQAAQKVIEKEVDLKTHKKLINEFIAKS